MSNERLETVQRFTATHILGNEKRFDSLPDPSVIHAEFHQCGLANWWIPKAYGGRGVSLEDSIDIVEELAYGDAGVAFTLFIAIIGSSSIALFGTEEHKERFLRPMAERGTTSATLGSERDAGSELAKISTTATRSEDGYLVRGKKFFSTNAGFAEHWMVIAKTPKDPNGWRALLVSNPRELKGVQLDRRWAMMGVRGSATYEISFDDCRVPADAVLAKNGVRVLEVGLNPSRILIAASAIGIGRRIRDLCLDYAREKKLKDAHLLQNAVFASKIGQMEMELESMRRVCKSAAREYDTLIADSNGQSVLFKTGALKSAIVAKMHCGQAGWRIASVGSEMFGGLGYTDDLLIGKLLRDIRYVSVVEGGDDVLRDLLYYRHVLPHAG
jgi:alkylation response protein AidB-like acyl-CoA dehydrogenase